MFNPGHGALASLGNLVLARQKPAGRVVLPYTTQKFSLQGLLEITLAAARVQLLSISINIKTAGSQSKFKSKELVGEAVSTYYDADRVVAYQWLWRSPRWLRNIVTSFHVPGTTLAFVPEWPSLMEVRKESPRLESSCKSKYLEQINSLADPCTRRRIFLVPRPPPYSKFVNMAIVLPQLGPWAESHIQAITQATTQESFNEAFDAFVTKDESHLEIIFNGVSVTRDEYKARLKGEAFDEAGASVQFNGIATVPGKDDNVTSNFIGEAGIFYTAIIAEGIVIRDAPVERRLTSSINISVKNDPTIHKPATLPVLLTPPHT
ncbi:hypothetical protein LENED_002294 [Lentinula edodes]|uniref:Uncharacterized protein n=1 Tax=Lentinula edodes TaxID=5353 RepID=A0A1Q3E0G7_LENED|nr:hypothetical protein LENED_002294 [Lentinula edodes]